VPENLILTQFLPNLYLALASLCNRSSTFRLNLEVILILLFSQIVWDAAKNRWVDLLAGDEATEGLPPPPPMAASFGAQAATSASAPGAPNANVGNGGVAMAYSTGAGAGPGAPAATPANAADRPDGPAPSSGPNMFRQNRCKP